MALNEKIIYDELKKINSWDGEGIADIDTIDNYVEIHEYINEMTSITKIQYKKIIKVMNEIRQKVINHYCLEDQGIITYCQVEKLDYWGLKQAEVNLDYIKDRLERLEVKK